MGKGTKGHFTVRSGPGGELPKHQSGHTTRMHAEEEKVLMERREKRHIEELNNKIKGLEAKIVEGNQAKEEIGGVRSELKEERSKTISAEKEITSLKESLAAARSQIKGGRANLSPSSASSEVTRPSSAASTSSPDFTFSASGGFNFSTPKEAEKKEDADELERANEKIKELTAQLSKLKNQKNKLESEFTKEKATLTRQVAVLMADDPSFDVPPPPLEAPTTQKWDFNPNTREGRIEEQMKGNQKDREEWRRMIRSLQVDMEMWTLAGTKKVEEMVRNWGKKVDVKSATPKSRAMVNASVQKDASVHSISFPPPRVSTPTPSSSSATARRSNMEIVAQLSKAIASLNQEVMTLRTENTELLARMLG